VASEDVSERRLVFFLDFLGFSDATKNWRGDRANALLDLLVQVSSLKGSFNLQGHSQRDGSYRFHDIRPEVSTFSDCIFGSFHMPTDGGGMIESLVLDMWLQETVKWVGTIAKRALEIGLLVRGGLTIGNIYHADSVVFGEALVDAYTLESRIASNPRVVVSPSIVPALTEDHMSRLLKDKDGFFHVNYFREMVATAGEPGPGFLDNALSWANSRLVEIDNRIAALNSERRYADAGKWAWFRGEFIEAATKRLGSVVALS
jgi:hypothetical protein